MAIVLIPIHFKIIRVESFLFHRRGAENSQKCAESRRFSLPSSVITLRLCGEINGSDQDESMEQQLINAAGDLNIEPSKKFFK